MAPSRCLRFLAQRASIKRWRMISLDQPARGHLAMLAFSLLIAGSFSLGSLAANEIDPVAITALRFAGAAVIMGAVAALTGNLKRRDFSSPWRYLITGALMAIYFTLMFEGLKTASPVSTSAVFTLTPIMAGVFGWFLLRQVATPRMAAALSVGAAGALWVIFRADLEALIAFRVGRGETIFFFGCIAHAIYTPLMRLLNRGETPLVFVFGMSTAGSAALMIYGWRAIINTDWQSLPPIVWITLVYITVIATAMSFAAVNYATMRLPSAKVMAYTYLTPSWVILWEGALGHGLPRWQILAGVLVTVIALLLLLRNEHGS